jgi:NADH:ubiquinone oxidoreductase subunit E
VVCLGACDKAPMMQIDLEYFERLTSDEFDRLIEEYRKK